MNMLRTPAPFNFQSIHPLLQGFDQTCNDMLEAVRVDCNTWLKDQLGEHYNETTRQRVSAVGVATLALIAAYPLGRKLTAVVTLGTAASCALPLPFIARCHLTTTIPLDQLQQGDQVFLHHKDSPKASIPSRQRVTLLEVNAENVRVQTSDQRKLSIPCDSHANAQKAIWGFNACNTFALMGEDIIDFDDVLALAATAATVALLVLPRFRVLSAFVGSATLFNAIQHLIRVHCPGAFLPIQALVVKHMGGDKQDLLPYTRGPSFIRALGKEYAHAAALPPVIGQESEDDLLTPSVREQLAQLVKEYRDLEPSKQGLFIQNLVGNTTRALLKKNGVTQERLLGSKPLRSDTVAFIDTVVEIFLLD